MQWEREGCNGKEMMQWKSGECSGKGEDEIVKGMLLWEREDVMGT